MNISQLKDIASVVRPLLQADGTAMRDNDGNEMFKAVFENWRCKRVDGGGGESLVKNLYMQASGIDCSFEFLLNPATRAVDVGCFIVWNGIRHDIKSIAFPERRGTQPESIIFNCRRIDQ